MSVYAPNLDKFTSVFFVAPMDNYELEVIKSSVRTVEVTDPKTQQKEKKPILSFLLRIINGESSGTEFSDKPVNADFWLGNDDRDWQQLLKFVGAVHGITMGTTEADEQLREKLAGQDLAVDAEAGTIGTAYTALVKGRVRCALSQKVAKNDPNKRYQQFGTWLPF